MVNRAEGLCNSGAPTDSIKDIVPEECTNCSTFDARFPISYLEHQVGRGVIEPAEAASLIRSGLARCARSHDCPVAQLETVDPLTAELTSV